MPFHDPVFQNQLAQSLDALAGLAAPDGKTVAWSAAPDVTIEVDFTVVESLGCRFRELRLSAEALRDRPFAALQEWADALCRKITYLLEPLGPLESDSQSQTVLVRSHPPAKAAERTSFYELLVQAPGVVTLRRYLRAAHDAPRQPVEMQAASDVFLRLVRDLVEAVPHEQALPPL